MVQSVRRIPIQIRIVDPMVDDFSEIIAWNQSNRNFMSGCCYAA